MALIITEACINCSACEPECPNQAIYAPSEKWKYSDGTLLKGTVDFPYGNAGQGVIVSEPNVALSDSIYFIVPEKCTECVGFHEQPQCAAICPENCCVKDPEFVENKEELLSKKEFLH